MKFMRIFPLFFVAGFALAAPEGEEKRQGEYCVCVGSLSTRAKVDKCYQVPSIVNSVAGEVTSDGDSFLSNIFPPSHTKSVR
jgi:hypothetical protein